MQAKTSAPQFNSVIAWIIAGVGIALMVVLLLSFMTERGSSPPGAVDAPSQRIAYIEFGINADTLWLANPIGPSDREEVLRLPHAAEYGVVPSVSPRGDSFVYTVLPPNSPAAAHDSPAELWLAELAVGVQPVLLAADADLLVEPVWSPEGTGVVYRRSTASDYQLMMQPLDGDESTVVSASDSAALFPVGFAPAGDRFYYVAIDEDAGSRLLAMDLSSGAETEIALLDGGLTRDWVLSPDATLLAYLAVSFGSEVASQALLLDLETRQVETLTGPTVAAFGPTWSDAGELALGSVEKDEASLLRYADGIASSEAGPQRGFEVPISFPPSGSGYLVRAFEGESISAPGRSTLTLVGADGERRVIATGEVTFVGWTD